MTRARLQQALGALEIYFGEFHPSNIDRFDKDGYAALTAIREYLDKTKGQEPVAWLYYENGEAVFGHPDGYRPDDAKPLYLHPKGDE